MQGYQKIDCGRTYSRRTKTMHAREKMMTSAKKNEAHREEDAMTAIAKKLATSIFGVFGTA